VSPNILMVYPEMPPTYWSLRYALPFIGKKAAFPPVGLLTVAALLPPRYRVRLIDMNVERLKDAHIAEADLVFTSSMVVQQESLRDVISRCRRLGKPVVAGGPHPTSLHETLDGVDHFVLGEAEATLPPFLSDYEAGRPKHLYTDEVRPDITKTPPPRFDLIRMKKYACMALQYSRGCPHGCEFCDIIELFGRVQRTKTPEQVLREMDVVYRQGYRGNLFFLDDNFIGNRRRVKELLPELARWQRQRRYPFAFFTEATLSLSRDEELMDLMVRAGFNMVFLGIETPDADTLRHMGKAQNLRSDMLEGVRRIQRWGMEVSGGFILGFDTDPEDIFERQGRFICEAGIPTAMVGLLTALPNTRLHRRLEAEGRIRSESSGNNTHDLRLNFRPAMEEQVLLQGYKRLLAETYSPKNYFERCLRFLKNLKPHRRSARRIRFTELRAFFLSLTRQSFTSYGWQYWKFLFRASLRRPRMIAEIVTMAIKGHHFFTITRSILKVDRFREKLRALQASWQETAQGISREDLQRRLGELKASRDRMVADLRKEARRLNKDFRRYVEEALENFQTSLDEMIHDLSLQAG